LSRYETLIVGCNFGTPAGTHMRSCALSGFGKQKSTLNGRFRDSSIVGSKDLQKENLRQVGHVFKEVGVCGW